MDGINSGKIWTIVKEDDIPNDANIIGGRFIMTLNNCNTTAEKTKVQYFAQGFNDHDKHYLVNDTITLRISSNRTIPSFATIMVFLLFLHDVTQAYIQIKSRISQKVYKRPKKQDFYPLGIKKGELFGMVRPLYGLSDEGGHWSEPMDAHLIHDLGMR